MTHSIRRVAVLGAGTMGAAIAAHCANAGLQVDLLDIAPKDGEDKTPVVDAGYDRMVKARPPALMAKEVARRIRTGNFDDDLERVAEADWVLEAILERLEPKRELAERVEALAKEDAIISSNTSGIPLHQIAEGRSESFRRRFLGTHFFNPPRYLKLLEIIPTEETDEEIVERVRNFGERVLGKGGVIAKDTPNFIGNRLGSFAGMQAVTYAFENGYSIEEVDAITGPLIGHPKTATFRLNDTVGLDIAVGVAENLYEAVPEDESREDLKPHPKLKEMQEKDLLGNKTGAGFYKRDKRDGNTVFDVLDTETFEHRPAEDPDVPIVAEAQKQGDLGARLRFLVERAEEDRHARYIRDTLYPYMAYASRRLPEISDTLEDADHAMEWGFAHETGPFRTWDLLGVRDTVGRMEALGIEVGPWVKEMLEGGNESFYKTEGGRELQFSPVGKQYEPVREDPMYVSLDALREEGRELERNDSASLLDLGDGVLLFEFHSKGNSIDAGVTEIGYKALEALERGDVAGLVEAGVGLIPAGGGIKEMVRRLVSRPMSTAPDTPALPFLNKAVETIAMAKVSASAVEARGFGFLDEDDRIVMNPDHLISAAKREVLDLSDGYAPPERDGNVYASGASARSALVMGIRTLQWGRYASEYDGVIAGHTARVLTGGDLTLPQWVDEEYLLNLEREAFLDLLKNEKTHERIEGMLKTGKPVRN